MGNHENELALALKALRAQRSAGELSFAEFEAERAALMDHFCPQFGADAGPAPKAPVARPWAPIMSETKLGKDLDPDKYAIDPETGRVVALTDEARKAMTVSNGASGRAAKTARFPSGAAIAIGFTASGSLVSKFYSLGAGCSDPYKVAAKRAATVVKRGGLCWYGYRTAGYDVVQGESLYDPHKRDRTEPVALRPARDRLVGKTHQVGASGASGLALIDAKTGQPVKAQERIAMLAWLQACNETEAVKRLARFIPKIRTSKSEQEEARWRALNVARQVPYHERPHLALWASGTSRQLDPITHGWVSRPVRVRIGCSTLDSQPIEDPDGLPFVIRWSFPSDALTQVMADVGYGDPILGSGQLDGSRFETYTHWDNSVDPEEPDKCRVVALELALRTLPIRDGQGSVSARYVAWSDASGEHIVTRDDALKAMTDDDKSSVETSDDAWWECHRAELEARENLRHTSRDNEAEKWQEEQLALLEASAGKRSIVRALVPEYRRKNPVCKKTGTNGTLETGRARNSRKGGTWDRRASAQGLNPGWRK